MRSFLNRARARALGGLFPVALSFALGAGALPALADISVAGPQELRQAIANDGVTGVIELAAGDYGAIKLSEIPARRALVIRPASPGVAATFNSILIEKSAGISIIGVTLTDAAVDAKQPRHQALILVRGSEDVSLTSLRLLGGPYAKANMLRGVRVMRSRSVRVKDNLFLRLERGAMFRESSQIEVIGNHVRDMRVDGFDFVSVEDVHIASNRFGPFHKFDSEHDDAIQFWTRNSTTPSRNVLIERNVAIKGDGGKMQTVFMGNEDDKPYADVIIRDNLTVQSASHGITVGDADRVRIERNLILAALDSDRKVGLRVFKVRGGVVVGNTSMMRSFKGSSGLDVRQNVVLRFGNKATLKTLIEKVKKALAMPIGSPPVEIVNGFMVTDALRSAGAHAPKIP